MRPAPSRRPPHVRGDGSASCLGNRRAILNRHPFRRRRERGCVRGNQTAMASTSARPSPSRVSPRAIRSVAGRCLGNRRAILIRHPSQSRGEGVDVLGRRGHVAISAQPIQARRRLHPHARVRKISVAQFGQPARDFESAPFHAPGRGEGNTARDRAAPPDVTPLTSIPPQNMKPRPPRATRPLSSRAMRTPPTPAATVSATGPMP